MNFNFYDQYKNYSNIELLKIIRQSDAYQPAAIVAAKEILNGRQISDAETEVVDKYFQEIQIKKQNRQERIDSYKDKATDFLEPVLRPSADVKPRKWLNILLVIITLQYAWTFYNTLTRFISYLNCKSCGFDFFIFLDFVTLIYVPIIFFLLFKRKRWGWILLFADNLIVLISQLSQSYIFFKYQYIHHGNTMSFILPIIIRGFFAFFLWQDKIADLFNLTQETKKKTAIITILGALSFVILLNIMF